MGNTNAGEVKGGVVHVLASDCKNSAGDGFYFAFNAGEMTGALGRPPKHCETLQVQRASDNEQDKSVQFIKIFTDCNRNASKGDCHARLEPKSEAKEGYWKANDVLHVLPRAAECCEKTAALRKEVSDLPPVELLDDVWMASCRNRESGSKFSKHNLLFQPDCRNFNQRSPGSIQAKPEVIQEEVKLDLEELQKKANSDEKLQPILDMGCPFVRQCWSLRGDDWLNDSDSVSALPQELQGRTVVLLVLGFRHTFSRSILILQILRNLLKEQGHIFGEKAPVVMSFLWPACFFKGSYVTARTNAWHARAGLRELLSALQSLDCRITIVSHSLGCKASLTALLDVTESEPRVLPCSADSVSHLILLSPAVASDAFCSTGRFPRDKIKAEAITVVSSEKDDVLGKYFPIGEAVSFRGAPYAMGLKGPSPGSLLHRDIWLQTDVSHNEKDSLNLRDVRRCIVAAAAGLEFRFEQDDLQTVQLIASSEAPNVLDPDDFGEGQFYDKDSDGEQDTFAVHVLEVVGAGLYFAFSASEITEALGRSPKHGEILQVQRESEDVHEKQPVRRIRIYTDSGYCHGHLEPKSKATEENWKVGDVFHILREA